MWYVRPALLEESAPKNTASRADIYWACSCYLELGRSDNLRVLGPNLRKVFLENEKGCDNINISENEFYAVLEEICSNQYQKNKKKIIEKNDETAFKVAE